MTALLLSLASATAFGASDFLGGLASRKTRAITVAGLAQIVGLPLIIIGALLFPATNSQSAMLWGALAGLSGATGLMVYFRALAMGAMGVTAPIASLVGAAIPVAVGLGLGERPAATAMVGIVVGIAATVLVSRPVPLDEVGPVVAQRRALLTAITAGVLFGIFFVALAVAPADSGLWPLVSARVMAVLLMLTVLGVRRPAVPSRGVIGLAAASGVLDMTANILFLLAVREGLLVLTSVVTGLYPVGVVVLAWLVLRERLVGAQLAGVGLALTAAALIAI
jgi:drug/metabolite transporter (DMT)-like permease